MALRDVSNFKFLSEAIVQKFRNPDLKSFRGIPYGPQTNPHSIFGRVYTTFRELNSKGLNLHQYLNIEKRDVLENLYRNLKSDVNLKFLDNPDGTLGDPRFELPDQFYQEQPTEITAAQQGEQMPVGTTGTPLGRMPVMPSAPSIPSAPRIHIVQQAPPPAGGMEGGTGQGSAATNKSNMIEAREAGPATAKANRLEAQTAALQNKTQLATAANSQTPQISRSPDTPGFNLNNFKNPKVPSSLKTLGSNTQIFAKKNLGRIGRGIFGAAKTGLESANPFLGRMGTGLVSNLTTIANPGGFGGGSRSIFGKFNRFGRGGRQTVSSFGKNVKSKKWLLFLFGILGFMMLVGGLTIIGGNNPTGVIPIAPSPGGGDITSCTFYRGGDGANAGMKLNNPAMAGLFTDISDKVGVPAAILAGIMRVESPSAFSSTADYLTNDYEAKSSEEGAIGIMQFMPGTFTNIFNSYSSDLKTLFNKTSVKNTVDPQNSMAPANVFRIYSIRDSITAAALKIKTDKLPGDWNENTVRDIASMYYSGARLTDPSNCTKYDTPEAITAKKKQDPNYNPCVSGPYDYGDDLWKSYNSCQSSSNPLPGGKPNIKFYCEDDPAWQYACSINYYGCGPSSTAIVVSSLGLVKTPVEIDQMFRDTGARSCGNYGSTMSLFFSNSTWFNDNFTYQYLALNADGSLNLTQAKEYLDNGYLIVASSHQFPCPNPGGCGPGSLKQGVVDHIFAIDDVNINQNLVHVEDPVNCRPEHTSQYDSNQWISNKLISLIPDSVEYNKSHPWFFAAAIKRKGN